MKKINIMNLLSTIFMIFMLLITFNCLYQRLVLKQNPVLFGYSFAIVLTGSMEDSIMINDMIITKDFSDYQVGDVISYKLENSEYHIKSVTHRIIDKKVESSNVSFVTKGDANNIADKDVVYLDDVIGKVIVVIPNVGNIVNYIKTPEGILSVFIVVFIFYYLLSLLSSMISDRFVKD